MIKLTEQEQKIIDNLPPKEKFIFTKKGNLFQKLILLKNSLGFYNLNISKFRLLYNQWSKSNSQDELKIFILNKLK